MKHLVGILATILVFGCTTYPQTPEEQLAYHISDARAAISEGNTRQAGRAIDLALKQPGGAQKVQELFSTNTSTSGIYNLLPEALRPREPIQEESKARDMYRAYLETVIGEVSTAETAAWAFERLSTVKSAAIFADDLTKALFVKLEKKVTEGNVSGSVAIDLGDNIDNFPTLRTPPHRKIIVDRTIKILQDNRRYRPIKPLVEYIRGIGPSEEVKRIESLLPTMNIKRDELEVVAMMFPDFAAARKEQLIARVFLQVKGGDRILLEDLLQTFRTNIRGVEWVPTADSKTITLNIERLRHDERTQPERSQTVTYAQHEVNLIAAALLMPRNAAYLYEVISGGAEIEYGYVVMAVTDGKTIHDELVRGKVGGEYRRCQNARIQNVFGGVTSAGFVANSHMEQMCAAQSAVSIDALRGEVFSKLVEVVLKVRAIKAVHDLN